MLFNSYIFVFVFLPAALLGYFLLNRTKKYTLANCFLVGMSLWFYGYFNYSYLPIICVSITANYCLSKLIQSEKAGGMFRKILLTVGLALNIGSIFYFKYYDFFIENVNAVFRSGFTLKHLVLPLGISFFTFQQVSYVIDSYRGETKDYGFAEYALFVSFFPQLIAGPIVLHDEILPQLRDASKRSFNTENAAHGLYFFAIGLFKKVILADTFSAAVTAGYADVSVITSAEAWLVSVCYTLQIYFDFSGYSDMAIGLGKMFNIDLPQNFDSPYMSTSITEFWGRWHMTLTRFLRKYVYFPLGGSKKGTARTYLNIMIVFLVSGLWHGANWTFVIWGVLHGALNVLNRIFKKPWEKLNVVTRWAVNFVLINSLLVVFRSESMGHALGFLKSMFSMHGGAVSSTILNAFSTPELYLLRELPLFGPLSYLITNFSLWFYLGAAFFIILNVKNCSRKEFRPTPINGAVTCICLFMSVMSFAGVSEFLYFNF